jgi:hypothetical protein
MKLIKSLWLPLVVSLLCSVHLCQTIFFSGGELIPGNLGDTRLCNLILEHNYQGLIGNQEVFSPSQFYPKKYTIFYASNFFGSTPIYIIPRLIGFSLESSFQIWFVLLSALNALAFLYLLKVLKVTPRIGYPLTFAGVSSSAFIFKIGHPQLLAIFPFFFCLAYLFKFLQEPKIHFFWRFGFFLIFQHYCDMYQGFFTSVILLVFGLFYVSISQKQNIRILYNFIKDHKVRLALIISLFIGLLFALYFPYYLTSRFHGTRDIQELLDNAPRLSAWFTASPHSLFYSSQNFLIGEQNPYEKHLFSGFTCYLIIILGLILLVKKKYRNRFELNFCFCLIITVFFLIILMTTWKEPDFNLWLWISAKIEPLRAFRAFARVGYLLFSLQVLATAILLHHLYKKRNEKHRRCFGLVVISWICAFESIALDQSHKFQYEKCHAQDRVLGLERSLDANKSYDALVFCPGLTLNLWNVHLDAWALSLKTGIPCLNGYSGQVPKSRLRFMASPTRAVAVNLVESLNLNKERVAFIETWSSEMEKEYPVVRYHLDEKITISTEIVKISGSPCQTKIIKTLLNNPTLKSIPCKSLSFHPSYRLYDNKNALLQHYEPLRSPIDTLTENSAVNHEISIKLPNQVGIYKLKLQFVHEHVKWVNSKNEYIELEVIR